VDSFTTNFIPIGAGVVWGPKTEIFYQILENQRLVPAYLLHNLYKIFRVCGQFHDGSHAKIWQDSIKGFQN